MTLEVPIPNRVRLGRFELNVQTGELRSIDEESAAILLPEQAFQILKTLVERGGKIATREDIRKALWPEGTIVNFDHSINVAVRILRRAFSDSAENPQYVETLARRGYRLRVQPAILLTGPPNPPPDGRGNPVPLATAEMVGAKVSHYRVLGVIGGGGMGIVYRAEDLKLGRSVALKFLPPEVARDSAALRRFEREARTASNLNHPNICTVHEIEEQDGNPFIVMELLEGRSLNHAFDVSHVATMPIAQLLTIAVQICDGLQAAHERGVIHRDIKPANIFLTNSGPVKILDFGLAKLMDAEEEREPAAPSAWTSELSNARHEATITGAGMGTTSYMSPEQVCRETLDARTDLFSFGVVLYEAATGVRPFSGENAGTIQDAILHSDPVPVRDLNPHIPRKLDAIIARAIQKDPSRRFQSAAQMRAALEKVPRENRPLRLKTAAWLGTACIAAVAGSLIWIRSYSGGQFRLSPGDTVVLAVTNHTGDPVFNDAVYIALLTSLQQTPYLNVLAVNKVGEVLARQHLSIDPTRISAQIAREVCLESGSKVIVHASISDAGNDFHVELTGMNCNSGKTIAHVQKDATDRSQVVHASGVSVAQLRQKLGEPESSVREFNKPLEEATSSSPDALQFLTDGYRHHLLNQFEAAASAYVHATEVDPGLALAFAALAGARGSLGEETLAAAAAGKAFALRDRLTEPSRFNAEDLYYLFTTGELDKRCHVLSQWTETFPNDQLAHYNFAECLRFQGHFDRSLAEARESLLLLPSAASYASLVRDATMAGQLDEAWAAYKSAEGSSFDSIELHESGAELAFLRKDKEGLEQQWKWAAGKPDADRRLLYYEATIESLRGHYREYERLSAKAEELAAKENSPLDLGFYSDDEALREAEVGNFAAARQIANGAVARSQNRDSSLILALALAREGETAQAEKIADKVSHEAPEDTLVQHYYLPVIRAAAKLSSNDAAGAIDVLRLAAKYDLADLPLFGTLYPSYLRGLAYLQLGKGRLAAAEFKTILDHPYLNGANIIGPLSRLQMARAQRLAGDLGSALNSYDDFLRQWSGADAEMPLYRQSKIEEAHLQASR